MSVKEWMILAVFGSYRGVTGCLLNPLRLYPGKMLRYVNLSPVADMHNRTPGTLRRFRIGRRKIFRIHRDFRRESSRERGQRHLHGIVDLFIHCVVICPADAITPLLILGT